MAAFATFFLVFACAHVWTDVVSCFSFACCGMRLFSPRLCLFHIFRRQSARFVILASWLGGVRSVSLVRLLCESRLITEGLRFGFRVEFLEVLTPRTSSSWEGKLLLYTDLGDGIYLLSFFLLSLSLSLNLALRACLGPSFSVSAGPGALCDNEYRFERGSFAHPRPRPISARGLTG